MRTLAEANPGAWSQAVNRRDALKSMSVLALGALVGCTPLRLALRTDHISDVDDADEILRAFVTTVVPLADPAEPELTRAFYDPEFGFPRCSGFFVKDLRDRAKDRFGGIPFTALSADQRAEIVRDGLDAGGLRSRVYTGAVFLSQVSFYAGIYDDRRGCPAIDFDGRNRGFDDDDLTYPEPDRFFGAQLSADGNPS
jgi:hypothetical protein